MKRCKLTLFFWFVGFLVGVALFACREAGFVLAKNATTTVDITGPDIVAPIITNVSSGSITKTTAIISWDTNEPASSYVDYGTSTSALATASDASFVYSHSIALANLIEDTLYYYQVRSVDGADNSATDNNSGNYYPFRTSKTVVAQGGSIIPPIQPKFESTKLEILLANGASYTNKRLIEITFRNYSGINFVKFDENANLVEANWQDIEDKKQWLLSEKDGKKILYFQFFNDQKQESEIIERSIILDTIPPSSPVNFQGEFIKDRVELSWLLPSEGDTAGIRVFRNEQDFVLDPLLYSPIIFEGRTEKAFDFDIKSGKTYFYSAFSYDHARNYSQGALFEIAIPKITEKGQPIKEEEKPSQEAKEIFYQREVKKANLDLSEKKMTPELSETKIKTEEQKEGEQILALPIESFHYLEKTPLTIVFEKKYFPKNPEKIFLHAGDKALYAFEEKALNWEVRIETPPGKETFNLEVEIIYPDKTTERAGIGKLFIDPRGYVYQKILEPHSRLLMGQHVLWEMFPRENRLKNVKVTLYQFNQEKGKWQIWNAETYSQINPQFTDQNGEFGFMVPDGRYYLLSEKPGFGKKQTKALEIDNGIVNPNIEIQEVLAPWWRIKENAGFVFMLASAILLVALGIFWPIRKFLLRK